MTKNLGVVTRQLFLVVACVAVSASLGIAGTPYYKIIGYLGDKTGDGQGHFAIHALLDYNGDKVADERRKIADTDFPVADVLYYTYPHALLLLDESNSKLHVWKLGWDGICVLFRSCFDVPAYSKAIATDGWVVSIAGSGPYIQRRIFYDNWNALDRGFGQIDFGQITGNAHSNDLVAVDGSYLWEIAFGPKNTHLVEHKPYYGFFDIPPQAVTFKHEAVGLAFQSRPDFWAAPQLFVAYPEKFIWPFIRPFQKGAVYRVDLVTGDQQPVVEGVDIAEDATDSLAVNEEQDVFCLTKTKLLLVLPNGERATVWKPTTTSRQSVAARYSFSTGPPWWQQPVILAEQ